MSRKLRPNLVVNLLSPAMLYQDLVVRVVQNALSQHATSFLGFLRQVLYLVPLIDDYVITQTRLWRVANVRDLVSVFRAPGHGSKLMLRGFGAAAFWRHRMFDLPISFYTEHRWWGSLRAPTKLDDRRSANSRTISDELMPLIENIGVLRRERFDRQVLGTPKGTSSPINMSGLDQDSCAVAEGVGREGISHGPIA